MESVEYSNLKRGEIYLIYYRESIGKSIFIFELVDEKPILQSFSIIKVRYGFQRGNNFKIFLSEDRAFSIFPTDYPIFQLSDEEIQTQILIPSI